MFQCRHCNRTSDRFNPLRASVCDSRNYSRVIVRNFTLRPMEVLHGKFIWGIIIMFLLGTDISVEFDNPIHDNSFKSFVYNFVMRLINCNHICILMTERHVYIVRKRICKVLSHNKGTNWPLLMFPYRKYGYSKDWLSWVRVGYFYEDKYLLYAFSEHILSSNIILISYYPMIFSLVCYHSGTKWSCRVDTCVQQPVQSNCNINVW